MPDRFGYVALPGTWGEDDPWWTPGSDWSRLVRSFGWTPTYSPVDLEHHGFHWSCDLDGTLIDRITGRQHRDWDAAGDALAYYLNALPYEDRNLVAHSHAGQVVGHCLAAHGGKTAIRSLLTVCTPVRDDMAEIFLAGTPALAYWEHWYSPSWWGNRMQWFGSFFDGYLGIKAAMPLADRNVRLPSHAGHSRCLTDPDRYTLYWSEVDAHLRRAG